MTKPIRRPIWSRRLDDDTVTIWRNLYRADVYRVEELIEREWRFLTPRNGEQKNECETNQINE